MWFKGLSFLSYTALLVAPTNAAHRGRGGLVHNGRNQLAARRHNAPYLHGRQQAWKNETRSSVTSQESEPTVSEPVVIVTSDLPVTSTANPVVESSSAISTEEPLSTTVPVSEAPSPSSNAPIVEAPAPSSDVTPPKPSSSSVEDLAVSDPVKEPAPVTSVVPSLSSDVESSIPTSSTLSPTSESVVNSIAESKPLTTVPLTTFSTPTSGSASVPISSSIPDPIIELSLAVPEPTSAPLPSPSISVPVEEPSSTGEPNSSAIQLSSERVISVPEPTTTPSVVPEPAQPEPSSQQEASRTGEHQPSATSAKPPPTSDSEPLASAISTSSAPVIGSSSTFIESVPEPTSTEVNSAPVFEPSTTQVTSSSPLQQLSNTIESVPEPTSTEVTSAPVFEPSTTQVTLSSSLQQPPNTIATGDGENPAPVIRTSSASTLVIPSSSLISEGAVAPTSISALGPEVPLPSNTVPISTGLPEVATTSATVLLPLPSDILAVPSSVLSGISSLLSSMLDPSKVAGPNTELLPSASQTSIDVLETTAPTVVLASSNDVQPTSLISGGSPTPSITSDELSPVASASPSASDSAPLIPASESNLVVTSTSLEMPLASQIDVSISTGISLSGSIPTGITISGSIPASESLSVPTSTSDLAPIQTGVPQPSVTGTGLLPDSSLVSSLVSSQVPPADSTALIEESNTKDPLTTSAPAALSPLPSFEVVNTAISSSVNQTDVPTPTGIPASETLSIPTTAVTGLPSTGLPVPGSTTGISGPTNATEVSSGFFGSATSGQFPMTSDTAQPLPTKIMKEDTQAPIVPIPTSESIISPSVTGSGSTQLGNLSPTSGSAGPTDGANQPSGTSAGDEAPATTGMPAGNDNPVPSPTVPAGVESNTSLHPSSTTTAAAAAPPPAPLSKSQTAGIAIGGTTCLLFALVAGLFVARRYHSNAAGKRQSKGVYPEVAYLYDPPTGDRDAEAGGGVPAMSGGASGYGALAQSAPGQGLYGGAMPPPTHSPRHSMASAWPADSNEPASGNPFNDPLPPPNHALHMQNISRHGATDSTVSAWPTGNEMSTRTPFLSPIIMPAPSFGNSANHGRTDTAVSAWPAGNQNRSSQDLVTSPVIIPRSTFQNAPKHEPNESTVSAWPHNPKTMPESDNPFMDPVAPGPLSSAHVGSHGGSVNKEMEEYVSLAINPYAFNPHAVQYPPMSPYVLPVPAPTASRDSDRYSDPFSDPFEHDLLLNVDMRSETPDSIHLVTAPSPTPTPRSPNAQGRYTPEPSAASNGSLQPIARVPVGGRYSPEERSYTPDSLAPPRGFTPDGRYTPTPELNSGLSTLNNSPVIGPLQTATAVPMHKGWDDMRTDDQLAMPSPLNLAQPMKKKPIPLRRQPTLAGAGQILLQGPGLPLIVKRKEVGTGMHGQNDSTGSGFGLEVPSMYGSPGPTINDFGGDLDSQRKRSGELMFADPQLVGRKF